MEILSSILDVSLTVLLTALMFGVLIFVHEFGHFAAAKFFKVKVNEFSLGMGPKLFKFGRGETTYSLRALPIGGFVSMEGEDEDSDDPRAFRKQKVWKRIIICSAGVFMNFVLGFLVATILVASSDSQYLTSTTVSQVISRETEESALKKGDKILSISGYRIFVGEDISFGVSRSDPTGKTQLIELETEFVVLRDGEKVTLSNVKPFTRVTYEDGSEEDRYSFYVNPENKTFFNILRHGFFESVSYVRTTVLGLLDILTGRVGIDGLGGVVKVGQVVGEATKYGIANLLTLVAMISVNLGVMNLLPIPALDGGRIVLLVFEGIFRKPLNSKIEYALIAGSMILLLALTLFITVKDVISIF
ncbi:MAG: site-2 protease family protein [Oscillospiraceae bacterium]|nr:site-2 protease family protein [Oscillospiraceae bacterium]